MELLFPENSFFDDLLDRFSEAIKYERERTTKTVDTSCSQILFYLTVLLAENTDVFVRYACKILDIVVSNISWTMEVQNQSTRSLFDIANILLSVRATRFALRVEWNMLSCDDEGCLVRTRPIRQRRTAVESLALIDHRKKSLSSPNLVSTAVQCLLQFWKNAASSISRNRVKWLLEQLFAVVSLPEGMQYSQRLTAISLVTPYNNE